MRYTTIITVLYIIALTSVNAQKTCNKPKEDVLEDLGSITKCSIQSSDNKSNKKVKQLKVRVSVNRKRFFKKRSDRKSKTAVKLASSGIKKMEVAKNKTKILTSVISSKEIKEAKKFIEVDNIPTFNKCKNYKDTERMDCFNNEMINHVNKNFYYPVKAVNDKIEGTIWIRFIINKEGRVSNVKVLGKTNTSDLKDVARYVVSKLPKFTPGTKNGKPVSVKYGFPIDFSLQE